MGKIVWQRAPRGDGVRIDATLVVGVKAHNPSTLIIAKSPGRPIGRRRPEDWGAPRSFDFIERVPLPAGGCGVNFIMQ